MDLNYQINQSEHIIDTVSDEKEKQQQLLKYYYYSNQFNTRPYRLNNTRVLFDPHFVVFLNHLYETTIKSKKFKNVELNSTAVNIFNGFKFQNY